jgi:hypothetical protein
MIMRPSLLNYLLVVLWLPLLSTSCGGSAMLTSANPANTAKAAGSPVRLPVRLPPSAVQSFAPEVFDAESLPGNGGAGMVTIETDLLAEITVVAFPSPDIGLDYMIQGVGGNEQLAAAEAHTNISVTLSAVTGGALIWARPLSPNANVNDLVRLHVRVPHNTSLVIKATNSGNIKVSGEVGSVHAHTTGGAIEVNNVIGPLQLTTENGSITVDAYASPQSQQVQPIELHARSGNINLIAVGATVLAETTEGNIHFVGSLSGDTNFFSTTGDGRVLAALPNDLSYRFDVTTRKGVVNDFMPAALICAVATSPDTQMRTDRSPDVIGQIQAADTVSNTYSYHSVMGWYQTGNQPRRPYLYFEDDHSQVTGLLPPGAILPGGNAAQAFWSPDCDLVKQQAQTQAAAHLKIRTENGNVALRLIRKH